MKVLIEKSWRTEKAVGLPAEDTALALNTDHGSVGLNLFSEETSLYKTKTLENIGGFKLEQEQF